MEILKKILKVVGIIIVVLVIVFLALMMYNYVRIQRGDLIKFNNHFYTKEQMEAFPAQYHEAPEQNTPEEVYVIFRQALLNDDIELALEQISEDSREEYKKIFSDEVKLIDFKKIPEVEKVIKEEENSRGNRATYYYYDEIKKEGDMPFTIKYEKDWDGYWKIDFI